MNLIKITLLSLLLFSSCANAQAPQSESAIQNINVTTAQEVINKEKIVLLDVRTPDEYAQGHIPGAQNLDFYASNFEEELKKLDPNQHYVVYCASGNRSGKAGKMMENLQFQHVQNVMGGFQAWQSQNLPVE